MTGSFFLFAAFMYAMMIISRITIDEKEFHHACIKSMSWVCMQKKSTRESKKRILMNFDWNLFDVCVSLSCGVQIEQFAIFFHCWMRDIGNSPHMWVRKRWLLDEDWLVVQCNAKLQRRFDGQQSVSRLACIYSNWFIAAVKTVAKDY